MKNIILAQNISIAKEGLKDIVKNLSILNNSKQEHNLDIKLLTKKSTDYLEQLQESELTISQVDEMLDFISVNHKSIFDVFT
jgi:hypothetical protein